MSQPQESRAQAWARLRFSIIGPLLAAPPGPGQLAKRLAELAALDYRHPISGQPVRFGTSTIERWFYRARDAADPMRVLRPSARRDRGEQPTMSESLRALVVAQYRAHGEWNARLLYDSD